MIKYTSNKKLTDVWYAYWIIILDAEDSNSWCDSSQLVNSKARHLSKYTDV